MISEDDINEIKIYELNYYKIVAEHKEIVRIVMGLQGVLYMLRPDVQLLLGVS